VKLENKLTIYPTNTTLIAGKIDNAPLCKVNGLYEKHGQILCYLFDYLLQSVCTKVLDSFDRRDKLITFWRTLCPGNLKPLAV